MINGTFGGRPVYVEQRKFDGTPFEVKTGAVIKYCTEEGAWVFLHENIRKDRNHTKKSDCPWLLRSPQTTSFNLLEVPSDWYIWTGIINTGASFQAYCNTCESESDCNYHGTCSAEGKCVCEVSEVDDYVLYTGTHCEYPRPCFRLRGLEGDVWNLLMVNMQDPWKSYGRGVYRYATGSGNISHAGPYDDLALIYTGSRWFAALYQNALCKPRGYWLQYAYELHAFWDRIYDERTYSVSDPTTLTDPIAVDFFRIGARGEKYGPLGELFPLQDPPGSGYFECAVNSSLSLEQLVLEALQAQAAGRGSCSSAAPSNATSLIDITSAMEAATNGVNQDMQVPSAQNNTP